MRRVAILIKSQNSRVSKTTARCQSSKLVEISYKFHRNLKLCPMFDTQHRT